MTASTGKQPTDKTMVSGDRMRQQIVAVLSAWGMRSDLVETTAEVMADTDLSGIDSHGMSLLILYEDKIKAGILNLKADPHVVRQNAVTALIDADAGLGHPAMVLATRVAIEKAKASGIAAVSVTNSHHFGAAGYYARMAAKEGLVSWVTSNANNPLLVPTRASVAIFGTNPMAIGIPARRNPAFLLDMATSTVAANKIRVYAFTGKPMPDGWMVDEKGEPVTDSVKATDMLFQSKKGGLTPIGGRPEMSSHKGYGLAMIAQLVGGTMAGGVFPALNNARGHKDGEGPDNLGHFIMALDPKAFRPDDSFLDDVDDVIDFMHAVPAVDPALPVLVPGDPEEASRKLRNVEGVPIAPALMEKIRGIAQRAGAPFLLA